MIQIACGPLDGSQVRQEITFICFLVATGDDPDLGLMYGVGCHIQADELWKEVRIPRSSLPDWINRSIQAGIYRPGESDLFICDGERVTVRLCHESDIHIETADPTLVRQCVDRWLRRMYRVMRSDGESPAQRNWREIQSVAEAVAGM